MTFAEILAEVYLLTNRPDLEAETKSAIKAATLKAHYTDFYSKDIYEDYITFDEAAYHQSIDYIALITNFRALKYIRKWDTTNGQPIQGEGCFLKVVTPDNVLDAYHTDRVDICYVAGRNIEIKSSTQLAAVLFGCYVSPIVTESGYSSWVADLYPWAIIFEAARVIFKSIGYDEQSRAYDSFVAEQYTILRNNNLSDVGS